MRGRRSRHTETLTLQVTQGDATGEMQEPGATFRRFPTQRSLQVGKHDRVVERVFAAACCSGGLGGGWNPRVAADIEPNLPVLSLAGAEAVPSARGREAKRLPPIGAHQHRARSLGLGLGDRVRTAQPNGRPQWCAGHA